MKSLKQVYNILSNYSLQYNIVLFFLYKESTQLQFRCDEKEQVVQELHQELVTLKIESREAQAQNHSLQGELSSLQQLMTDLKDVSEGKGKRIQQLSDLIDTEKKKVGIY